MRLRARTAVRWTVPDKPPNASSVIAINDRTGYAPDSFTCDVDVTIRRSRSKGSASSVANVIGARANWFPAVAADFESADPVGMLASAFWVIVGRIEIGIIASSDSSGSSSLSSRYVRIAPPMTATPMSLIFASGMPLRISFRVSIVV